MVAINLRHVPPGTRNSAPGSGPQRENKNFGGALRRISIGEFAAVLKRTLLLMAQFMAFGQGNWDE
jgi:hypothetical protein